MRPTGTKTRRRRGEGRVYQTYGGAGIDRQSEYVRRRGRERRREGKKEIISSSKKRYQEEETHRRKNKNIERQRERDLKNSNRPVLLSNIRIENPKNVKGRGGVCIKIESRASGKKLSERLVR